MLCLIFVSLILIYKLQNTPSQKEQACAYLAVFKDFYPPNRIPLLIRERKTFYISVDLSNVHYKYPELIKAQIENYLRGSRVILLWDNMNDLIESGLVQTENGLPCLFENGELFCCEDKSLTKTQMETKAYAWAGNLGGFGATYRVEKNADAWEIKSKTDNWIS